jgi:hypothetical protein
MNTWAAPCSGGDRILQGDAVQRHVAHVLAGLVHRFLDGHRHLAGLAITQSDPAIAVAHHGQRGEAELPAALDHLGHAVDGDQFFLQTVGILGTFYVRRHAVLFLKTPNRFAGGFSQRLDPAVVLEAGAVKRDLGDPGCLGLLGNRLALPPWPRRHRQCF